MISKILVPVFASVCLLPWVNAGVALLMGVCLALAVGNPYAALTSKLSKKFLAVSVIGLGAGMDLLAVAEAGVKGIGYTAVSIALILVAGIMLGRLLRCDRDSSLLVTVGTAICGGSAIAAIAPVINARAHSITIAMSVVFVLNAVALFLFPMLGHQFDLSQHQFGLWSALAIHDTSSVVGAAAQYGDEALQTGATVKLARALWIVPLVFAVQWFYNRSNNTAENGTTARPKYSWFILGFLLMAGVVTFIPAIQPVAEWVEFAARRLLVVTLFLIGAGLTREALRSVGIRPLIQGIVLWLLVLAASLYFIYAGHIF